MGQLQDHAPEPSQVSEGRDRKLRGEYRPDSRRRERPFYCRSCGKEQVSAVVPRGWYTLNRGPGHEQAQPIRLGVYCCLDCLFDQAARLRGIDESLGERFDTAPSEFRHVPTRGYTRR